VYAKPIQVETLKPMYVGYFVCEYSSVNQGLTFDKEVFLFGKISNSKVVLVDNDGVIMQTYHVIGIFRTEEIDAIATEEGPSFFISYKSDIDLFVIIILDINQEEILRMACRKK